MSVPFSVMLSLMSGFRCCQLDPSFIKFPISLYLTVLATTDSHFLENKNRISLDIEVPVLLYPQTLISWTCSYVSISRSSSF